ncbi:MAG: outer membrane beta-barrel protein [Woeseiaceae bacterium]
MRHGPQIVIAIALTLAGLAPVSAQQLENEFTVFGAYRFGGEISLDESDATYEANDSPSFGLIWNRRHQRNTQWEVFFSRQDTEVEISDPMLASPSVDVELYTLQLGGTYLFDGDGVRPYLAMTLGGTHVKANAGSGDSDTFVSGSLGLGLKFGSSERLGFRIEARLHSVLVRDSTNLFCQTGPDLNVCAIEVEGDTFGQLETFAGVTFGF